MLSPQEVLDKYGYIVMGWRGAWKVHIGEIFPAFWDVKGDIVPLDAKVVVIGFTDQAEWEKQSIEAFGRFSQAAAHNYHQYLKVIAE